MSGTRGAPRHEFHPTPQIVPGQGGPIAPDFVFGPETLIPSGALPAWPTFTAPAPTAGPAGSKRVTFWVTYTRGAAGGFPVFRVSASYPGGASFRIPLVDQASFLAANPNAVLKFYMEELEGPVPADGLPIKYELTFLLPANGNAFLAVAERGVPATPGTIEVEYTLDG